MAGKQSAKNPVLMGEAERVPDVGCLCDTCGKSGFCGPDDIAPKGWFAIVRKGFDFRDGGGVVVCSAACKAKVPWRRA